MPPLILQLKTDTTFSKGFKVDVYNNDIAKALRKLKKKLADDLKKEGKAVKQVLKEEFNSWFDKEAEFKEQQQNNNKCFINFI